MRRLQLGQRCLPGGVRSPSAPPTSLASCLRSKAFRGSEQALPGCTTQRSGRKEETPPQGTQTWHLAHNPSRHVLGRYPNHLFDCPVVSLHKKHRHRSMSVPGCPGKSAPLHSHACTARQSRLTKATAAPSYSEQTQLRTASSDASSEAGLHRSNQSRRCSSQPVTMDCLTLSGRTDSSHSSTHVQSRVWILPSAHASSFLSATPEFLCAFLRPPVAHHDQVCPGCWQNTCLALVEAVDDATQGTADVSLGSIRVVEEFNAQGQRVLPQVKALGEGAAGQVPHVQAAPVDP